MNGITIESKVYFKVGRHGRKHLLKGEGTKEASPAVEPGNTPRISKLMALAVRFEDKLRDGQVRDMAQLARYGHVSRARLTQIMNLRLLAPDIQEQLLGLPKTTSGRNPINYQDIASIVQISDWGRQRKEWAALQAVNGSSSTIQSGRDNKGNAN